MRVNTRTTSFVLVPVEAGLHSEGVADEAGQVDRAEQAGAVGRQRLLAARVGRADVFAPPGVVHLVDAVDQDETGFGIVVGGHHDHVPQVPRAQLAIHPAGDQAILAHHVPAVGRPLAPLHPGLVGQVLLGRFGAGQREQQRPVGIVLDGLHEAVGDQQRQVELAQPTVLALGADELAHVRMRHIERAHLRTATTAGRGHGETHLVEDIHEGHRPGGVRAGAGDERPARSQCAELIADAAAGLEGEPGFVDLLQDAVHRVFEGARDGAVDRAGGRFVRLRASVGDDPPGRNGATAQCPGEAFVPVLA